MKIILDTDFLINSLKYKIDIISELNRILDFKYELKIIDKTLEELEGKPYERLVLKFLELNNIKSIKTDKLKNVDNLILDLVDEKIIIATQDKGLKRLLKQKNIQIITIRQKKYLKCSTK